jgi:hypothetical protein
VGFFDYSWTYHAQPALLWVAVFEFLLLGVFLFLTRSDGTWAWIVILALHYIGWTWFVVERGTWLLGRVPLYFSLIAPISGFVWIFYARKNHRAG